MMNNSGIATAEMTLALVDTVGRKSTEWLIEWAGEFFEYPCEAWKIEEYVHVFEDETEALEWYDMESMDELNDNYMVFEDAGLDGIIVFE